MPGPVDIYGGQAGGGVVRVGVTHHVDGGCGDLVPPGTLAASPQRVRPTTGERRDSYPSTVPVAMIYSPSAPNSPAKGREVRVLVKPRPSSARRALTHLGLSDPKENIRMAEALLSLSAQEFTKRWNFDPVQCHPLTPGRYQWVKAAAVKPEVTPEHATHTPRAQRRLEYDLDDLCASQGQSTVALLTSPLRSGQVKEQQLTPRTKQSRITEFGRHRKRLHSTSSSSSSSSACPSSASKCAAEEENEIVVMLSGPRKKLHLSPSKRSAKTTTTTTTTIVTSSSPSI